VSDSQLKDDSPGEWRGPEARQDARVELAGVRTGLAMERTRMSSDRTLMAIMRTSLALISFGFFLFEFVDFARNRLGVSELLPQTAPRTLGMSLTGLGIGVLALGIGSHSVFLRRLAVQRRELQGRGLVPPALDLPGSLILTLAILLLISGVGAILRMAWRAGLFG
jgi:putative membrane protein